MTNNNMWDCADMRPMISTKCSIDDSIIEIFAIFFVFLVCKCILVIHCCFQNRDLYYNFKKNMCCH
jgi:hypothetical protein